MKFATKFTNYTITLVNGISANPLAGTAGKHGVYVKFENGLADIKDPELVRLMLESQAMADGDIIAVEETDLLPRNYGNKEPEPLHTITEMQYGSLGGTMNSTDPKKLEINNLIKQEAIKLAKEMLPSMVEEVIKSFKSKSEPAVYTQGGVSESIGEDESVNDIVQEVSKKENTDELGTEDKSNGLETKVTKTAKKSGK